MCHQWQMGGVLFGIHDIPPDGTCRVQTVSTGLPDAPWEDRSWMLHPRFARHVRELSRTAKGVNLEVESSGAPKTESIFRVQPNGNPARRRMRQQGRLPQANINYLDATPLSLVQSASFRDSMSGGLERFQKYCSRSAAFTPLQRHRANPC